MASSCGRRVIGRRHTKVVLNVGCAQVVRCERDLRVSGEGKSIFGTKRSANINPSMTTLVDSIASGFVFRVFSKFLLWLLMNLEHRDLPPAPVLRMGGGPRLEDTRGKNEKRESVYVCERDRDGEGKKEKKELEGRGARRASGRRKRQSFCATRNRKRRQLSLSLFCG